MPGNPNPVTPRLTKAGPGRPKGSKNHLSRERLELEIKRLALLDPVKVFERYKDPETGKLRKYFSLREVSEMDEDTRRCIASIKVRRENLTAGDGQQDETVEIRFWDKVRSLELGARCLGMLRDKVEITVSEELVGRLDRAKARAREGKA